MCKTSTKIKKPKVVHASFVFSVICLICSILLLFEDVSVLYKAVGLISSAVLTNHFIMSLFSWYEFDECGVWCISDLSVGKITLQDQQLKIRWEDVEEVDGVFGIFPPYVITVRGTEAHSGNEIEFLIERRAPNIDDLYQKMKNRVRDDRISEDVKANVGVFDQ